MGHALVDDAVARGHLLGAQPSFEAARRPSARVDQSQVDHRGPSPLPEEEGAVSLASLEAPSLDIELELG